ncbi:MAG TPA: ubiquinol-cytochrome c reductase iron-sulfur subunit [Candidatus Angelobacter sp.]|jgi:cytochrome b6-f complex iron-sulfur subunit|nr:ubiquinol-cytochrome c reductase iron-sulfur subunit [Candidatus Angelobacter sp.]
MKIMKQSQAVGAEPAPAAGKTKVSSRRAFLRNLGLGALLAGIAGQLYAYLRALMPNVLYEPPRSFKVGPPQSYSNGLTYLEDHRMFIGRDQKGLYAISAICTHLGCTVKMVNLNQPRQVAIGGKPVEIMQEFHCPCHGSKYYGDGTNYAGPAPHPLDWYRIEVSPEDGQLIVHTSETVHHDFRLNA